MFSKRLNKIISVLIIATFFFTNINTSYASPGSKSLFKNKKVDYDKINTKSQDILQKKQSVLKGEDAKELESQKRASKKILQSNLSDISQIHIPQELGRVVEVHQGSAGNIEDTTPLIVGIQDLHTNPEAELNLAKILEILLKDYNMGLVCSEGAVGKVDTSSVSSFPDSSIREKVSRIFINSGELTGEEYLSITKYPELPIWGIETKDIYFNNIIGFNKIMKFNPSSQVFISQTKKAIAELKPKIYSKDLLDLDQKESEFSSQKLDTAKYIQYLTGFTKKPNISMSNYKNISILTETMEKEKTIDQLKIMKDSQNLLLNLQSTLQIKSLNNDLDGLMARASLFKDQKISPFSFYSYLKDLALKHIVGSRPGLDGSDGSALSSRPGLEQKYPELNSFIDYLTKVNSLDSTKLFTELEDLNYEIKESLSKTEEQKTLVKLSHNINFLENFFNLKVSNEDLDYYLNNKDSHKVTFFKDFLPKTLKKYNISAFIDYNPDLIDSHLQELEDFYKVVKDRDIAMVTNALSEIEKRNVKLATLIHGGFHTKGITKLLKEKGYSYIIVSPYSKTDIDEENYHFLLSGRRKPIEELLQQLDLSKIIDNLLNYQKTLRVPLALSGLEQAFNAEVAPALARIWGVGVEEVTIEDIIQRIRTELAVAAAGNKALLAKLENLTGIEVATSTEAGTVIVKLTPKKGYSKYFKVTKDRVTIARADDFKAGEAVVAASKAKIGEEKSKNYKTYADKFDVPELAVLDKAQKTYDDWVYRTLNVAFYTHQATQDWFKKNSPSLEETETIKVWLTDEEYTDVNVAFIPTLISLAVIRVGTLNGQEALFLLYPGNTYIKAVDMPFLEAVKTMRGLGESITNEEIIRLMSPEEIHDITVEMSISNELIERYKAELKRFGGTEAEKREMENSLAALEKNYNATGLMDAYRVVHSTTRGPGKGGIRFTHHGDFGTVRTLAAIMAWKCALADIPYGGAKAECVFILKLSNGGSIKIDPRLLSLEDKAKVDRSLARGEKGTKGLAHIIGPLRDVPAGDVNTSAFDMRIILDETLKICVENDTKDIDGIPVPLEVLKEAKERAKGDTDQTKTYYVDAIMDAFKQGKIQSVALMSLITGKPFTTDESTGDLAHDWAGGHAYRNDATGVTQARITEHAIANGIASDKTRHDGKLFTEIEGATASYQGFGNVGIPAALESHILGVKVMGLSDVSGSIYVTNGQLPVDEIVTWFKARQKPLLYDWYKEEGVKLGVKHDSEGNFVLFMDVDMIFPDAKEGQLTEENADNVKAIIVSEGANAPTTPEADKIFQAKGIRVIPDFLANGGGVIGSYFEWLQTLTITPEALKTATQEKMYEQGKRQVVETSNKALDNMIQYCIDNKIPFTQLRQVAIILAIKKILNPEDFAEHEELTGEVVVGSELDGRPITRSLARLLSKQGRDLPVSARITALAHEIFADPEILTNLTKDTLAAVALQYGLSRGHPILLNYLSGMLGKEGITAHPDTDVVILDGTTDAEHILAKLLITKDDTVVYQAGSLSEQAKDIYKYYGAELIEIDLSTAEGIAELEKKLKSGEIDAAKLKFIQVLSDTEKGDEALSQDARKRLIALAKKYDLLLVEDGRYRPPVLSNKANSLKALDEKGPESRVIQLRNLSTLFGKEAELGCAYLVMPPQVAVKAEAAKSSKTLHPNGLVQAIVYKELLKQYGPQKFQFPTLSEEEKNPQLSPWLADKLSSYGKNVALSEIRRILKLMNIKGLVSFAGGMPAIELFPYKDTERLIASFSADEWKVALSKSTAQGLEILRKLLAERLNKENNLNKGESLTEENIIITEGSQDGLDLLGWLVRGISDETADRANKVITQKPTYLGFKSAAEPYGCEVDPYDLNSLEGLQKLYDDLKTKMDDHEALPSLIYVMPTFGNPNGDVMSLEARERLLEIANEFEIMIAEDNPYGALRYNEESYQPTLLELSKADKYNKVRVIYLGTVSKTFTPGMRIGWTVAPEEIINKLTEYKKATASGANPLNQLLVAKFITTGLIDTHVKDVLIKEYSNRRDAMIGALKNYMPEGVSWTEGHGGYFIWVTLPEGINAEELLVEMTTKGRNGIKLGFVPGWPFLGEDNQLRLSFPTNSRKVIDAGIQALAIAIKDKLGILAGAGGGAAAESNIVGIALDNIVSKIAGVSDHDAAVQLLKDNNGPAHAYFRYSIASSVAQILKERLKSDLVQVYLFERENYDSTASIGDDIDITVYLEDNIDKEDLRSFLTSLDGVLVRAYIDLGVDFSNGALLQPRIINREDVKQGREFTAFLQDANIMATLAPLPMLFSDVIAGRGADKGVITKEEHEGMRDFLRRVDARDESYARHDLEDKFDVRGSIRIYSVPGMWNATGFKGHYAIRDGVVYIDKNILEGKDGELYLRHEIFELEQILNFGRAKFQGAKGEKITEQEVRAKLVKWLDEKGPIGEVRAILLKFHSEAPKLSDESQEIIADVPASRSQAVTNLVAATTDEANIKAVVSNVYVPSYGTAGKDVVEDYISGRITLQDATTRLSAANDSIADVNIAKIILIAAYLGAKHKLFALGQSGIEVYLSGTPAKDAGNYIQMDRTDLTPNQIRAILEEADTLASSIRPVLWAATGTQEFLIKGVALNTWTGEAIGRPENMGIPYLDRIDGVLSVVKISKGDMILVFDSCPYWLPEKLKALGGNTKKRIQGIIITQEHLDDEVIKEFKKLGIPVVYGVDGEEYGKIVLAAAVILESNGAIRGIARPVRGAAARSGAANTGLAPTYSFLNNRLKDMGISVDQNGQLTYSADAISRGLNRDYEQAGMRTVGDLLKKKVIGKLADVAKKFLAIKDTVLYDMIHGLVPTPRQKIEKAADGSSKGWSTLNFTPFSSDLTEFPDGEIVKTTGHFNPQLDIQQVAQGDFISLQIKYDALGNPIESRAQYLKPGDIFYALPGYFHVTIPVGEGPHSFFDIGYADGKYKEAGYDWPNNTPAPYLFVNRNGKVTMVLNPDYEGKNVPPLQWYAADKLPEAQGSVSLVDLYARANDSGMSKILDAIEAGKIEAGGQIAPPPQVEVALSEDKTFNLKSIAMVPAVQGGMNGATMDDPEKRLPDNKLPVMPVEQFNFVPAGYDTAAESLNAVKAVVTKFQEITAKVDWSTVNSPVQVLKWMTQAINETPEGTGVFISIDMNADKLQASDGSYYLGADAKQFGTQQKDGFIRYQLLAEYYQLLATDFSRLIGIERAFAKGHEDAWKGGRSMASLEEIGLDRDRRFASLSISDLSGLAIGEMTSRGQLHFYGSDFMGNYRTGVETRVVRNAIAKRIQDKSLATKGKAQAQEYAPDSWRASLKYEPKHTGMGTSGFRGTVGNMRDAEPYAIASGFVKWLIKRGQLKGRLNDPGELVEIAPGQKMVLTGDFRDNSPDFMSAVLKAYEDLGVEAIFLGNMATPNMAYYCQVNKVAGIMITGSHTEGLYNGLKLYDTDGEVLNEADPKDGDIESDRKEIMAQVDIERQLLYNKSASTSIFDENGYFKKDIAVPDAKNLMKTDAIAALNKEARNSYVGRFLNTMLKGYKPFEGHAIIYWEQSTVARSEHVAVFEGAGAEVIRVGRRDDAFIALDTENMTPDHLAYLKEQVDLVKTMCNAKTLPDGRVEIKVDREAYDKLKTAGFDVRESIIGKTLILLGEGSSDGDGDRPVTVDEKGRFWRGDVTGAIAGETLGAEYFVQSLTGNQNVIDYLQQLGVNFVTSSVGSPYHVKLIRDLLRLYPGAKIIGAEVNGGIFIGSRIIIPIILPSGETFEMEIDPLNTRDAATVMLLVFLRSIVDKVPVSALFEGKLDHYADNAGLIHEMPIIPGAKRTGVLMHEKYTPEGRYGLNIKQVAFDDNANTMVVTYRGAGAKPETMGYDSDIGGKLLTLRNELQGFFTPKRGFGTITQMAYGNLIDDGFVMWDSNGDRFHVRRSGNAPETRLYVYASTKNRTLDEARGRAREIVKMATEPGGILREIEASVWNVEDVMSWLRGGHDQAVNAFKANPIVLQIHCGIQHYDWGERGDTAFIPALLEIDNSDGKPYAELWIGAHPSLPAKTNVTRIEINLNDLIKGAAEEILGKDIAEQFNRQLPYLLKVLAAGKMLSIQAHPNKKQAKAGFEGENARGIPIKAPDRNYKDPNHKPELIVAVTDFYALNEFRPLEEIAELLGAIEEFNNIMPLFRYSLNDADKDETKRKELIKELYRRIMSMSQERVDAILKPLINRLKGQSFSKEAREFWILKADEEYTRNGHIDRGIFSIYLLNLIHLRPEEAMYLGAGELHAYLEGVGMECMAGSDNVLRGGLTPKYVDISELLNVLTFNSGKPDILKSREISETEALYDTPAEEFMLSIIEVSPGKAHKNTKLHSADALIVMEGEVEIRTKDHTIKLRKGETIIIPAILGAYEITGQGRLYKASVPLKTATVEGIVRDNAAASSL